MGRALALVAVGLATLAAPATAQQPLGAWGTDRPRPDAVRAPGRDRRRRAGLCLRGRHRRRRRPEVHGHGRLRADDRAGPPSSSRRGWRSGRTAASTWSRARRTGRACRSGARPARRCAASATSGAGPGRWPRRSRWRWTPPASSTWPTAATRGSSASRPAGSSRRSIGQGSGTITDPDKLADPEGVAVAPDGTIWASDQLYRRVQHYSAGGAFLGGVRLAGQRRRPVPGAGRDRRRAGRAVRRRPLAVVDPGLRSRRRVRGRVGGTPGGGPGQFSHPFYVAVDCRGNLYVSDRDNNRIQRLGVPGRPRAEIRPRDASERLRLAARAAARQRFRRDFAVLARAACDRPCTIR